MSGKLIVATCQFAIVHFPECSLSGYAEIDFQEFNPEIKKHIGNSII